MKPFVFKTRIRFIDTDASGRIHYTALFRYFETAEIEFLRTVGLGYTPGRPVSFPRVHVECDYMLALEFDDEIAIEVRVGKLGTASVHFEFLASKNDALAAAGKVVIVAMDRQNGKSVPLPDDVRQKLEAHVSAD